MNIQTINSVAKNLVRDRRGAAVMEYLIIVGLVAIVCIAAYRVFGAAIVAKVTAQTTQVGGI